jgi:hypothetical protein
MIKDETNKNMSIKKEKKQTNLGKSPKLELIIQTRNL